MILSCKVTKNYANLTLIEYLSQRFKYFSKEKWLQKIIDKSILVDGSFSTPEHILKIGTEVSYIIKELNEPPANTNYSIIYEDDFIIAVNKPANLLVHKKGPSITKNLVYLLRHLSNNPNYNKIDAVNRLDRETSGIVLFSKDKNILKILHKYFYSNKIYKEYIAVVKNIPPQNNFLIGLPIGKDTDSKITYKFKIDNKNGKQAQTLIKTISSNKNYSLINIIPNTGRTHQIRVHLSYIGCPILGDKLYGMPEDKYIEWRKAPNNYSDKLEFQRQALHCGKIAFIHPVYNKEITICAELPDDMKELINKLELY